MFYSYGRRLLDYWPFRAICPSGIDYYRNPTQIMDLCFTFLILRQTLPLGNTNLFNSPYFLGLYPRSFKEIGDFT